MVGFGLWFGAKAKARARVMVRVRVGARIRVRVGVRVRVLGLVIYSGSALVLAGHWGLWRCLRWRDPGVVLDRVRAELLARAE